jgi:predicted nuclease of predicted toxin-antitoxin system
LKLLVDENLAPRLAGDLADLFPGSIHVSAAELGSSPDVVIWEYAQAHRFTFLTKDKDFASLSITWGAPDTSVAYGDNSSRSEAQPSLEFAKRRETIRSRMGHSTSRPIRLASMFQPPSHQWQSTARSTFETSRI